jgi:glyoxylase-like metal-dependent hydrolase (beta-lactamase superfamily II)
LLALDLEHLGLNGAICAYVLLDGEPMVIDPGPATTLETLERKLAQHSVAIEDLRHVVLTHVHLDHAGGTGHLAARIPELQVHVHIEGAPHMAEPEKLVASTRRTFGEAHDRLWGEVLPVPADRIRAWYPGERAAVKGLRPFATPGHINHHTSWLDEREGTFFGGDALGIILAEDAPTHPPTPPPAIDLAAWAQSLASLQDVRPARLAVTHFGVHDGFEQRRLSFAERVRELDARVREAVSSGKPDQGAPYEEEVREQLSRYLPREHVDAYFDVFPAAMDWAGARRYAEKALQTRETR